MPAVNLLAVAAATVAALVIGTIYYMPAAPTGKKWAELLKAPSVTRSPGSAMGVQVVMSIVSMCVLAVLIGASGAKGAAAAATVGLWVWVLVALSTASEGNFAGRPWSLWVVNQANWLITFLVAGALIGALS